LQSTPTKSKDSSDEEKDLKKELSLLKEHNKSLTAELAAAKSQGDDSKKKEISELKVLNDKMFDKQKLLNQQIKE
jgi:spermidine/putrescine-binding protein